MAQVTEAVYQGGVLKPVDKLDLADQQRVRLIVEPIQGEPSPDRAAALR
jgi:predicted DNA-binding antitoxin AbrB/MazE fold protein